MTNRDWQARLAALEARLGKLERAAPAAAPALDAERFWLVDRLMRDGSAGGEVAYGGALTTPAGEQFLWQRQAGARALFGRDWGGLDRVLSALGHPVRLAILRSLLEGRRTKADLENLEGLGTTGQLYHHLRALEEAGWVRSLERGVYGVPGERVVPLLAILAAAAG